MELFVICFVGLALIVFVCIPAAKREHAKFESFLERFPPISDAEFLARCPVGTRADVALKVRHILSESLSVDYERIHPSARLVADLGAE